MKILREVIAAPRAPEAIGPYSQGIRAGSLVFVSGQLGIDPTSGSILPGIEAQTRGALNNAKEILAAGGVALDDVVKTTVYLTDLDDFSAMNRIYAEFFPSAPPARATVQVSGLPKGARVEIEMVALLPEESS